MVTTRYLHRQLHLFGLIGFGLISIGFFINMGLLLTKYTVGLTVTESRPLLLLILGTFMLVVGIQFFSIELLGEMIFKLSSSQNERTNVIRREIY